MIVIDARGLQSPRPMELVIEALCDLQPGDRIRLILEREPYPLYGILERNGYRHRTTRVDEHHFEIEISAAGPVQGA